MGTSRRAARCQCRVPLRYGRRVSAYRIDVVIAPSALLRAQDGLDLTATSEAFLAALRDAALRELPDVSRGEASLALRYDLAAAAHVVAVEGPDETTCRRLEREVRDLVWVVRECVPFAVF